MFKGSNVALVTPFKNDKLDDDTYIKLIHFHIKNGTNGLVPAGTTGESPTLSHHEHERVIELCVKESNGKLPVFAGTGSNSTDFLFSTYVEHDDKNKTDSIDINFTIIFYKLFEINLSISSTEEIAFEFTS